MAKKDDPAIKKLQKKIEAELERKYSRIAGKNSKLAVSEARREMNKIVEKVHKKIVAGGTKEIQAMINAYDEVVNNTKLTLIELNEKLRELDAKTDALKRSGALPKNYVNKHAKNLENQIIDLQDVMLFKEQEKQSAIRAYINSDSKIQGIEKQALEIHLNALTNSKSQRMRILELQDKVLKIKKKDNDTVKKESAFGDFKSVLKESGKSLGFNSFEQERKFLKGIFSPLTAMFTRKPELEEKEEEELEMLVDAIKHSSQVYMDVGKKLDMIIPSKRKSIKEFIFGEDEEEHIKTAVNNVERASAAKGAELTMRKPSGFMQRMGDWAHNLAYGSIFNLFKKDHEVKTLFTSEEQLKQQKIGNHFLEKLVKRLLGLDDKEKKREERGFIGNLFHTALKGLAWIAAASFIAKVFKFMFPKQAAAIMGMSRLVGTVGKRAFRNVYRSKFGQRVRTGAAIARARIATHLPGVDKFGRRAGELAKKASFRGFKKFVQNPFTTTAAAGVKLAWKGTKYGLSRWGRAIKRAAKPAWTAGTRSVLTKVPVIGSLISGGLTYAMTGSKHQAIGAGLGSAVGSVAGGILGQMMIPIPVVGAAIGAFAGDFIGSLIGQQIGKRYEMSKLEKQKLIQDGPTLEAGSLEQNGPKVAQDQQQEGGLFGLLAGLTGFLRNEFTDTLASKIGDEVRGPRLSPGDMFSPDSMNRATQF